MMFFISITGLRGTGNIKTIESHFVEQGNNLSKVDVDRKGLLHSSRSLDDSSVSCQYNNCKWGPYLNMVHDPPFIQPG